MAALKRVAKPGNQWTGAELSAFNITIVDEDMATFFGDTNLPTPSVDPVILGNANQPDEPSVKPTRLFFRYLNDTMCGFPAGKSSQSAVKTFGVYLLGLLGYDEPANRIIHQGIVIKSLMCGKLVDTELDVCILDGRDYVGVIQGDTVLSVDEGDIHEDPQPKVIAAAIAAFYANNTRMRGNPDSPHSSQNFIGIALNEAITPMFFKIPITSELLHCVGAGQYPPQQTVVCRMTPPVQHRGLYDVGMQSLENRRIILQCFEALKQYIQCYQPLACSDVHPGEIHEP